MASYNELPKGWNRIPLREAGVSVTGNTPPTKDAENYGGKLPYIKPPQLRNNIFSEGEETLSEKGRSLARVLPPNSVLVSCIGNLGRTGLNQVSVAFNQQINAVIPNSSILPKFLFYQAQSSDFRNQLEEKSTATTISIVNKGSFEKVLINLAPLNEQKNIVAKIEELFSELDSGIASLKTAQQQLKIYRQALLKHAFEGKLTEQWRKDNADKLETPEQLLARIQTERETRYQQQLEEWQQAVKGWEAKGKEGKRPSKPAIHKPLSRISAEEQEVLPELPKEWSYIRLAEIAAINSGMSVSKNRKLADPIEVNYLRVANVQRGYLDLSEIKSMNIEMVDLPRLQLEINDVLFNEGGDLDKLGRGWIWEGQVSQCITQNHVFRASPFVNEKYHAKFISYWGNSFGRDYFEGGGKQTTNLASINKTVLSNFPIPLPSFTEQQEIVNQLEEKLSIIEQNEKEIESALAKAELLRQSILKKAFNGQLVAQVPDDEPASEVLARIQVEKTKKHK